MSHSDICCYPIPGKKKARLLCEAFVAGCNKQGLNAKVCATIPARLEPGVAVFYGVRPALAHLWEQAKREWREWIYIDNSYVDCVRETQFRVTRNRIQHTGQGQSDGSRFRRLGIEIKPMRTGGDYTLVCQQSREFMEVVAKDPFWLDRVARQLTGVVLVRGKHDERPFAQDLAHASRVVTWSSAAAIEAVLAGVPVTCSDQCAAYNVTDRQRWASVLSDQQWTMEELSDGTCWRYLSRGLVHH